MEEGIEYLQKILEQDGFRYSKCDETGIEWIALKPIADFLEVDWSQAYRQTRRDPILRQKTRLISYCVDGEYPQERKLISLPYAYIYGWICLLNSKKPKFIEYKRLAYDVLAEHFKEKITRQRKRYGSTYSIDNPN